MALDVGPLPGAGVVFHVSDTLAVGYCDKNSGEIGDYVAMMFNVGQGWVEFAVLTVLDGCQGIIDAPVASGGYGGNIGLFYIDRVMKAANRVAADLVKIDPHPAPVHSDAKYSKETFSALMYEYTEGFIDADGHPQFRFKPYP